MVHFSSDPRRYHIRWPRLRQELSVLVHPRVLPPSLDRLRHEGGQEVEQQGKGREGEKI